MSSSASRPVVLPESSSTEPRKVGGISANAARAIASFWVAFRSSRSSSEASATVDLPGADRSAVHAAQAADLLERVEVAADGLGGDAEVAGEAGHGDPADAVDGVSDVLVSLRRVHAALPPGLRIQSAAGRSPSTCEQYSHIIQQKATHTQNLITEQRRSPSSRRCGATVALECSESLAPPRNAVSSRGARSACLPAVGGRRATAARPSACRERAPAARRREGRDAAAIGPRRGRRRAAQPAVTSAQMPEPTR